MNLRFEMLWLPVIRRSKVTEVTQTPMLEKSFMRMLKWPRLVVGRGPERKSMRLELRSSVSVRW